MIDVIDILVPDVDPFRLAVDTEDQEVSQRIIREGIWEPSETKAVVDHVKAGNVVVDVGANIGYFTAILSKLVGDTGKVFAFEPHPHNFGILERTLKENACKNVNASNVAIADKEGFSKLFVSPNNSGDHRSYDSEDGRSSIFTIVTTLDAVLRGTSVDFIKMDIQGGEGLALLGMNKILKKNPRIKLLIEFWPIGLVRCGIEPKKFLEDFKSYGFKFDSVADGRHIEGVKIDFLLERLTPKNEGFTNLLCVRA